MTFWVYGGACKRADQVRMDVEDELVFLVALITSEGGADHDLFGV